MKRAPATKPFSETIGRRGRIGIPLRWCHDARRRARQKVSTASVLAISSPLVLCLLGTTQQTRPPCGNETGLLTLCGVTRDGRRFSDMLMVTATVRLEESRSVFLAHDLYDAFALTWSTGFMATPRVLGQELRLTANLCLAREASVAELVMPLTCQSADQRTQQRLVGSATARNDTDHATDRALDDLLCTAGKLHSRFTLVGVVSDDGDVVSTRSAQGATIPRLLLNVAHHGSFRHRTKRQHIANSEGSILSGVNELARIHALVGDEGLGVQFVTVRIAENNFGKRGAATGIVDYLLDDSADVPMALSVVVRSELGRCLVESFRNMSAPGEQFRSMDLNGTRTGVRSEDRATAFSLIANDATLAGSVWHPCPSHSLAVTYHGCGGGERCSSSLIDGARLPRSSISTGQ